MIVWPAAFRPVVRQHNTAEAKPLISWLGSKKEEEKETGVHSAL
jgi:hypothetical protein